MLDYSFEEGNEWENIIAHLIYHNLLLTSLLLNGNKTHLEERGMTENASGDSTVSRIMSVINVESQEERGG